MKKILSFIEAGESSFEYGYNTGSKSLIAACGLGARFRFWKVTSQLEAAKLSNLRELMLADLIGTERNSNFYM
jgi:hypothetical protein